MNDESDSRMVRLPVREMSDEPAPQRAAQEGVLPPLLTDEQIDAVQRKYIQDGMPGSRRFARAIESEVRTAIAAAGGGVPQGWCFTSEELVMWSEAYAAFVGAFDTPQMRRQFNDEYSEDARRRLREFNVAMLASSPQPEAAQPNLVDDEGVMNTPLLRAARLLVSGSHPSKDCAGPYMVPADLWLTLQAEVMESLRQAAARDLANPAQPEAAPAVAQVPQCRSDGRCQYAIDHGAEGLGHCPPGKCAMPAVAQSKDQA